VTERLAHDGYRLTSGRHRVGADVGHGLVDLLGEPWPSPPSGRSAGTSLVSNAGTGATKPGQSSGGRGVSREATLRREGAIASRGLNGAPRDQRSRIVWSTEVLRYSSSTTLRSGIHGEIAPGGGARARRGRRRRGDVVVGDAVLIEVHHHQGVVHVRPVGRCRAADGVVLLTRVRVRGVHARRHSVGHDLAIHPVFRPLRNRVGELLAEHALERPQRHRRAREDAHRSVAPPTRLRGRLVPIVGPATSPCITLMGSSLGHGSALRCDDGEPRRSLHARRSGCSRRIGPHRRHLSTVPASALLALRRRITRRRAAPTRRHRA
jgi:hypothetical protein